MHCVGIIVGKNNRMSTTDSKLSIENNPAAYIAIQQLVQRYTDVINLRNWKELSEIFGIDAVWEALSPINLQFAGLEAIREGIPASVAKTEYLIQFATGVVIELQSDTQATVRSHLAEFGRFKDSGEKLEAVGIFRDIMVKQNGVWKCQERVFELRYPTTV